MSPNLRALIPQSKLETDKAQALAALGYPAVREVLPEILECVADINWPIAQVFQPFLVSIGAPLAPFVREVLHNDDYWWQYNLLLRVVYLSPPLARELVPELRHLAHHATDAQKADELDVVAREILEGLAHKNVPSSSSDS